MAKTGMNQLSLPLLPEYSVRVSKRAKRVQLQVSQQGRIEVVVPVRFKLERVADFVAENLSWLNSSLQRLQSKRVVGGSELPQKINLRALKERWMIQYRHDSCAGFKEHESENQAPRLEIFATNPVDSRKMLHQWLARRAGRLLVPWLRQLSTELGLPFGKAVVRSQKTCWGSCSSIQTISINRSLLFLPPGIVRYLFVHELCHTVHANHSETYWGLVAENESGYQQLDSKLREAGSYVPIWAIS